MKTATEEGAERRSNGILGRFSAKLGRGEG
jgi:hypothetical protein